MVRLVCLHMMLELFVLAFDLCSDMAVIPRDLS